MAGKSAHGPLRLAEVLSSLEVFVPKGMGLMVQKSITPGRRAMAGPTDTHAVSGPKDKATAIIFPPCLPVFRLSPTPQASAQLASPTEPSRISPGHPRPLSLLQRGLAPRSKGKARAELRPAKGSRRGQQGETKL